MASNPSAPHTPTLDQLIDEHFDYLYRYAYRHVNNRESAEDLVQETFVAAAEALPGFQGRSTPRTWLTGILRFKICDAAKSALRELPVDFESLEREPLAKLFNEVEHWRTEAGPLNWGRSPDMEFSRKEFFAVLESCMTKLPKHARQIFLLRELEGFERTEIGQRLALATSHVGVLLYRARLALQQCLQINWFVEQRSRGGR